MDSTTREFIELALAAMQKAYHHEANVTNSFMSKTATKVGDVLQAVLDLSKAD